MIWDPSFPSTAYTQSLKEYGAYTIMMGVLYSETPRSLDPSSQTFQIIDLNSVQILIQYCQNNIHWPNFSLGSLILMRKYLKFRAAPRATFELCIAMINEGKNGPALPWILISDYEKKSKAEDTLPWRHKCLKFYPPKRIFWKGSKQMKNL
jgi:hypothetical protein